LFDTTESLSHTDVVAIDSLDQGNSVVELLFPCPASMSAIVVCVVCAQVY
jgi:hypothetical protein